MRIFSHNQQHLCAQPLRATFCVEGGPGLTHLQLQLSSDDTLSRIAGTEEDIVWSCSREVLSHTIALIEPLTTKEGHQFVDVEGGLAARVMISVDEYRETLRRQQAIVVKVRNI
jgi:hypothetical protein